MAAVVIVAGGFIGLIEAVIGLVLGLNLMAAFLVWVLSGSIVSLLILMLVLRNQHEGLHQSRMHSLSDDLIALNEAEIGRTPLVAREGASATRLLRIGAERDAMIASERKNRQMDP